MFIRTKKIKRKNGISTTFAWRFHACCLVRGRRLSTTKAIKFFKTLWFMAVSVSLIQYARKCPSIAAQYHACIASRKKDAKLCITKGSCNVDNTDGSSQNGLQDTLWCSLSFTKCTKQRKSPTSSLLFSSVYHFSPNTNQLSGLFFSKGKWVDAWCLSLWTFCFGLPCQESRLESSLLTALLSAPLTILKPLHHVVVCIQETGPKKLW